MSRIILPRQYCLSSKEKKKTLRRKTHKAHFLTERICLHKEFAGFLSTYFMQTLGYIAQKILDKKQDMNKIESKNVYAPLKMQTMETTFS